MPVPYLDIISPELWDLCISFLGKSDLLKLSLVCRALYQATQPAIFRELNVVLVCHGADSAAKRSRKQAIENFTNIAGSTQFAPLVKALTYMHRHSTSERRARPVYRPSQHFVVVLPRLVNIVMLSVWNVAQSNLNTVDSLRAAIDSLPVLRNLHIQHSDLPNGNLLPLESFKFSDDSLALVANEDQPFRIFNPETIQTLMLKGFGGPPPILRAVATQSFPALRRLILDIYPDIDVQMVVAILEESPQLVYLALDCHCDPKDQYLAPVIQLLVGPTVPRRTTEIDHVIQIFEQLSRQALPRLETLVCPYGLIKCILPGRLNIHSLSTFLSSAELPFDTVIPAIEDAAINGASLTCINLVDPLDLDDLPAVFSSLADCLESLQHVQIALIDAPLNQPPRALTLLQRLVQRRKVPLPKALKSLCLGIALNKETRNPEDESDETAATAAFERLLMPSVQLTIAQGLHRQQASGKLTKVTFEFSKPASGGRTFPELLQSDEWGYKMEINMDAE